MELIREKVREMCNSEFLFRYNKVKLFNSQVINFNFFFYKRLKFKFSNLFKML